MTSSAWLAGIKDEDTGMGPPQRQCPCNEPVPEEEKEDEE